MSIIIPALNEEGNIRPTCEGMIQLAEKFLEDYEILVFDDASTDKTYQVVEELQKRNAKVRLFRNPVNRGLGYNYRAGVKEARCRYTMMVPGDNEMVAEGLEDIFRDIGTADIFVCYSTNPHVRPLWRQAVSNIFTALLNVLFGLNVIYYNGPSVIRADLAKEYLPSTSSFAYMAVMLVRLLKSGYAYKHKTFSLRPRRFGSTKAFQPRNVMNVIRDILGLWWQMSVRRNYPVIDRPGASLYHENPSGSL